MFGEEGMAGIIVEQHAQKILPITDRAIVLDRGRIVSRRRRAPRCWPIRRPLEAPSGRHPAFEVISKTFETFEKRFTARQALSQHPDNGALTNNAPVGGNDGRSDGRVAPSSCLGRNDGRQLRRLAAPSILRAAPSGKPVRVGGTLSLTGFLAQTAVIHKIASEIMVEEINGRNGFLGRPVEYVLLDDQSKPEVARSLYEKLITVDKVDLIQGPMPRRRSWRRWAWRSATAR